MGFFEEFGELMKKYNFEIHTFQLDENLKILNDRFRLALRKEDLPPPVILFRTSEGDFVPTEFKTITINNEQKNFKFLNVKTQQVVTLFPVEEKKEEVKEQVKVKAEDKPKKKTRKSKKTKEEIKKVVEEVKQEATPTTTADDPNRPLTPEEQTQIVDTLNQLSEVIQMDWSNTSIPTPQSEVKKEEKKVEEVGNLEEITVEEVKPVKKYNYNPKDRFYIVGPAFKKAKCNSKKFYAFMDKNEDKLKEFNAINNFLQVSVEPEIFAKGNIKLDSDEGVRVMNKLKDFMKGYNVVICLKGWEKAPEAKQLVEYAKEQGKTVINEDEF